MKKWHIVIYLLTIFQIFSAIPARAEFAWRYVGGDPRSSVALTSQAAASWFISAQGQNDLARQGRSAGEREQVKVYVAQQGVTSISLRSGNNASVDNGRTWQMVQIRNLTFGQAGTCIHDSIRLAWQNCNQVTGYYPAGMSGWVPVVVDACGNMLEIYFSPPRTEVPPPVQAQAPAVTVIVNNNAPAAPVMMVPSAPTCNSFVVYPGGISVSTTLNQPSTNTNINVSATGGTASAIATGGSGGSITNNNRNENNNNNTNTNQNLNQNSISISNVVTR